MTFKNSAAYPLFWNSQVCIKICRRVVSVLCSLKEYLVVLWVQNKKFAAIRLFINSQTCVGIVEEKYSSWSAVSKYISLSSGSCVLQFVNAQFLKSNLSSKICECTQDLRTQVGFKPEGSDLYSLSDFEVPASSRVQIAEATHVVSKIQNYLKVLQVKFKFIEVPIPLVS